MNSPPDTVWSTIRSEVEVEVASEPLLASFLHTTILRHETLEDAISFHLAGKLETSTLPAMLVREFMDEAFCGDCSLGTAVRADIRAVCDRDPATNRLYIPLLYQKGFHALQAYRVGNCLWRAGRESLARHLQNRISEVFGVDIHPAARIGKGIFIDHATGVVIGETAVIEDDVSMLHEVTLGGTGKQLGDRHPKIRKGVLIGAGAKILGNVEIGMGAKVGAGSVVLTNVSPHCTVAGVPAKVIGCPEVAAPAHEMNHQLPEQQLDGSGI